MRESHNGARSIANRKPESMTDPRMSKAIARATQEATARRKMASRETIADTKERANAGTNGPIDSPETWPLASTNEGSKFRSLLIFDKLVSSTDPTQYTSETLSERVGRPDRLQGLILFSNVQGASPQATIGFETSFDGVRYSPHSLVGPFPISSGMQLALTSTILPLTNALVRGSIAISSGSAEVRGWLTSPTLGRRRFGVMAIDRVVTGGTSFYSASEFNDMFGKVDKLSLLLVLDQIEGTSVTITLDLEESPDGIEWSVKQTLLSATPIFATSIIFSVEDAGGTPGSRFVRARVALGGTTPVANFRLYVVGRGR